MTVDLVLSNIRAYHKNEIADCSLAINNGRILKIGKEPTMPRASARMDLKNFLVLPGLIDSHVHFRDEGKAYKEDFYSGTAAAAAGGFTTALDMPNNDPVTMNTKTLRNRMRIAERRILVNVGFYSEFPERMEEIVGIVKEGAVAFKLFMAEQVGGLDIDDSNSLFEAFKILSELEVLVAVHAEDGPTLKKAEEDLKSDRQNDVKAFLKAHSEDVEVKAITRLLSIAGDTQTNVHFCHTSTKEGLRRIDEARKMGTPATCETTPHHLLLSDADLERIGPLAITMPPARDRSNIAALWNGITNGWIDTLGSDHAPHTLEEKKGKSIWEVKGGIPGLETTLPLMLDEVNRKRLSIADIVRLLSEKPAEIFQLEGKGFLRENSTADLTVVDLHRKFKIDATGFRSKAKYSPFDGRPVEGKPVKTFVNGQLVMDEGEIIAEAGSGHIVRRE